MNLRLLLLDRAAPRFMKRRLLDELARATAAGFGVAKPTWTSRRMRGRLEEYARFTANQAELVLALEDPHALDMIMGRLHQQAEELGATVRRWLRLRGPSEAVTALRVLYKYLGIDMCAGGAENAEIVVSQCLFARYFTESVCVVVAALDEGMAAGLSGGGELQFVERITAGDACCRAHFESIGAVL